MDYRLMRRVIIILCCICLLGISIKSNAQRVAISTNLMEYLILSPNIEVECALTQHHAAAISVSAAPWRVNRKYSISHISISPEYKYWFKMPFYGQYVGADIEYNSYDVYWKSTGYDGHLLSGGVTYGWSFIIDKKWNLVPNIGVGVGADFHPGSIKFVPLVAKIGLNLQMLIR